MNWQFATAGRVVFGRGASQQIGQHAARLGLRRTLIVSDVNLTRLPAFATLVRSLEQEGIAVGIFDGCQPEPPVECAVAGLHSAVAHRADAIIALGGGSNIDVAKMMAVLVRFGGQPTDYFGFDRVPGPVLPLIACPTTAGTGSEVSHSSVLSDTSAGLKVSSLSPHLRPHVAIVDPAWTDSCPASVTAHSGIDALVHAIEAVTARPYTEMPTQGEITRAYEGSNAFTQLLAYEAIYRIGRSLVRAYRDGRDQLARDDMAYAALLAGMAFSNSGVALVHALEYPVGVRTHCSHGEGNGLLLPHVMRFNLPSRLTEFARVGQLLAGNYDMTDLQPDSIGPLALDAVAQVEALQRQLDIRTQLRLLGLAHDQLPEMANESFSIKRLMDTNPRTPSEADLLAILQQAY